MLGGREIIKSMQTLTVANSRRPRTNPNSAWLSTLHIAVQRGHDQIVCMLIERSDIDCNERDSEGRTPLMHAVIANHESIVSVLLQHNASIIEIDGRRQSVLHLAVIYRRESVLRVLLEHCSLEGKVEIVDAYNDSGRTALHIAVENGFESAVALLLEAGANLKCKARIASCSEKTRDFNEAGSWTEQTDRGGPS